MSTIYYPDPNADTPRGSSLAAIVSTTNTTPIEVEVTGHGYGTGDRVEVEFSDDPGALGLWNITVTGTDTFTLDGSVGTLAGGATGTVANWTILPNATLPSDGDLVDATNANTPVENALNVGAYPGVVNARYRLHAHYLEVGDDTPFGNTTWSTNNTTAVAAWLWAQNNPLLTFPVQPYSGISPNQDRFIVSITTKFIQTAGAGVNELAIGMQQSPAGIFKLPGSGIYLPNNFDAPITLNAAYDPSNADSTTAAPINFGIIYRDGINGQTFLLKSDWQINVWHLRANR